MTIFFMKNFFKIKHRNDIKKMIILGISFFMIIFSYTIVRELKDAVFFLIVGRKYIPDVKMLSNFFMIPLALFYGWLSTKIKRQNLLIFYCIIYGIGGLIAAYFLIHNSIGLINKISNPYRIFGWIFYLFIEGYSPFIVSVMWAFLNSISHPENVKNSYVVVTIFSKTGGVISALLAWLFMSRKFTFGLNISDEASYSFLMIISSIALLIVPIFIYFLLKIIPESSLNGYSDDIEKKENLKENKSSGFFEIFKYPYVIGIFGMLFFWEIVNVVFNLMRLNIGFADSEGIAEFSAFLYKNIMYSHIVALLMAIFGTSSLVNMLGERISLMLIPVLIGGALFTCFIFKTSTLVIFTYAFMRAINYAFAYPLREALYIPTSKNIQFKTKSWIDSFGSKFAKACGSFYNKAILCIPFASTNIFQNIFFGIIISSWVVLTYFLGKRWEKAIKNKEIIGINKEEK